MVAADITPVPEEQDLIDALSAEFEPLHRPDLPYHNFAHAHDDVLSELLALDIRCRPEGKPDRRRKFIAAALGHESLWHLVLDPSEGFRSKEERAAHIVGESLASYGFQPPEIKGVRRLIAVTEAGVHVETEEEIEMRRADIKNVAGDQNSFLANSLLLFYESRLLHREAGTEPLTWAAFLQQQTDVLKLLVADDLTLSFETKWPGVFNRAAERNMRWLSSDTVLDPARFMRRYGKRLLPKVPMLRESDLTGQAAA